jgi:hypothetical protein
MLKPENLKNSSALSEMRNIGFRSIVTFPSLQVVPFLRHYSSDSY